MTVNSFYSFNGIVAKDVDVLSAVILHNIVHWCDVNKANGRNKVEGRFWTYNSVKAYGELFYFATERQIRTSLAKLIDKGYLASGCFNKDKRDRTLWYTITEKTKSIYCLRQLHLTEMSNESDRNVKCIYKDTDINTNINTDNKEESEPKERIDYKKIQEYFNSTTDGVFGNIRYPFSEKRKSSIRARLKDYGIDGFKEMIKKANESDFLKGKNDRGFKATFDWLIRPDNFAKTIEGNYSKVLKRKNNTSSVLDSRMRSDF